MFYEYGYGSGPIRKVCKINHDNNNKDSLFDSGLSNSSDGIQCVDIRLSDPDRGTVKDVHGKA